MRPATSLSLILLFAVLITLWSLPVYADAAPPNDGRETGSLFGAWLIGAVVLLIAAFYAIRGPIVLPRATDNETVARFNPYQRIVHWFIVFLFLLLSVTGLILMYGKGLLEPLFGVDGFATMASAAQAAHSLFGPLFLLGLLLLIPVYVSDNLPRWADLDWFAAAGGYFSKPASAHRFNAGEKIWFWLVCIFGLGLSISGLMLEFTATGLNQSTLELAHVIHAIFAIVLIAVAFGHIYLATVGTEGTLRGMLHGSVERRWAAKHHDLWLREIESDADESEDKP